MPGELPEEAEVVAVKEADVVDAVREHGDTRDLSRDTAVKSV